MKSIVAAFALAILTLQPAFAASCWSSANGNHLVFPAEHYVVSYRHAGMVEACNLHPVDRLSARVWCDLSSATGVVRLLAAHRHPSAADRVWWDGQVFSRDEACPAY